MNVWGWVGKLYIIIPQALQILYNIITAFPICSSIGDGLFFNNVMVPNHGIITLEDIGISVSSAVRCHTSVADCCTDSDNYTGQWFFPGGGTVSTTASSRLYQVKESGYVGIQKSSGGAEGIYRCEIGLTESEETYYVGVYSNASTYGE